ncbi:MAG: glycosyltransferase family 4 protein, partial [Solirubrobacteraceae bacterium]
YRAVIAGTGGRIALPSAWRAARRTGVPFVFWAALWRTPRTLAHLAALPMMRSIYREAAAVVTYGEHVSAYVRAHGATRVVVAPQSVDNAFWSVPAQARADPRFAALFVGRPAREKGLAIAIDGWRRAGVDGTLTVVGAHQGLPRDIVGIASVDPSSLRNLYGAADVLVVPSIASRRFIEPWGLVVNEAMNQRTAVIASNAVGAAAGGLVRDGRNGLIVPAGDPDALARALATCAADRPHCDALGAAGAADVAAYTHAAWANAFVHALTLDPPSASPAASVET